MYEIIQHIKYGKHIQAIKLFREKYSDKDGQLISLKEAKDACDAIRAGFNIPTPAELAEAERKNANVQSTYAEPPVVTPADVAGFPFKDSGEFFVLTKYEEYQMCFVVDDDGYHFNKADAMARANKLMVENDIVVVCKAVARSVRKPTMVELP